MADIPAGAAQGGASLSSMAAPIFRRVYDSLSPGGVIATLSASPTNASFLDFALSFDESVTAWKL